MKRHLYIGYLGLLLLIFSCDSPTESEPEPSLCNEETEVELWGECYNIEETTSLNVTHSELTGEIPSQIGDLINVDFDSVCLRILSSDNESFNSVVEIGGTIKSNRAADIDRDIDFKAVTDKDYAAIQLGKELGITNYAFSFANCASDVKYFRKLIGVKSNLISKIDVLAINT